MKAALFIFYQIALVRAFVPKSATVAGRPTSIFAKKQSDQVPTEEVDVVVIGSGLAGLSCAALLSHCDKKTVVLEAHDTPGGAVSPNRSGLFRNLVLRRVLLGKSFSFYLHWNLFSDLLARPPHLIFYLDCHLFRCVKNLSRSELRMHRHTVGRGGDSISNQVLLYATV